MTRSLALAFVLVALTIPAAADDICPCIPVSHLWVLKTCDTWDCAAAEFNISGGSAETVVMPTSSTDGKWIVLHRVATGTAINADRVFAIENFDGWSDASTRFSGIDGSLKPMILSAPDGKFLVVSRNAPEPRRRAAAH
jgi:hypothetical protein